MLRWKLAILPWILVAASSTARAEHPTTPLLLPENTALLLWIPDAPDAIERFMNTATGRILRDPGVRPMADAFRDSLSESMATGKDGVGLSLSELLALPHGELALAIVATKNGGPAPLILMDTGDQTAKAKELLQRISGGGPRREIKLYGADVTVLEGSGASRQPIMFLERDGAMLISTSIDALGQVLIAWNRGKHSPISANEKFRAIMQRSREHNPRPQIVWYVDPILLLQSAGQKNPALQMGLGMFPLLGLDGLKAAGGAVEWDAGNLDSITHMHLLLESPRRGLLEMLAFTSGDTTPQTWVPADVSTYTTVYWDVHTAFRALRTSYDQFRGEGAFSSVLGQWIEKPTGLNFENDLLPVLTGRMTRITRIERPGTARGSSSLLAWQLKRGAKLEQTIDRIYRDQEGVLFRKSFANKTYYQLSPPPPDGSEPARVSLPEPCFGLLGDHLIIAEGESLYQTAIKAAVGSSNRLADEPDFQLIAGAMRERSGRLEPALIRFARPDEGMRSMYDMLGADQTRELVKRQAERSMFSQAIHSALEGRTLPPFETLQRYLAPGGGLLTIDEEGLHYTGITLRRK